jgi:hypothetical protein
MNMPTTTTKTNTIRLSLINFDALVSRFPGSSFLFIIVKLPLVVARTSYPLVVLEPPS